MNRNLRIRVLRIDKRRIVVKRFIAVFPFAMAAMLAVAGTAYAQETTPEMLTAAAKEGKVVWYTSVDVKVAEVVAKAFRAQYPTLDVARDAPTGYMDLRDPKWKGKLVKSHPGYSGTSLTGTFAIVKLLGWDYLEKLSKQGVLQLQSTTATPKSIASGERVVMVDGNEYNMFIEIDAKSPVKIVYPKEGTPFVTSPSAIFAEAPHPNAARVFENFLFTAKIQQLTATEGGTRSLHPDVKDPPGRTPLGAIKLLPDDPAAMLPQIADIKKRYTALFGN